MTHNKDFLILELRRFYEENGRVPKQTELINKNGYPHFNNYRNYFGSYNNALEIANLPLNHTSDRRTGNETCCECGEYSRGSQRWVTKYLPRGQVMCYRCYQRIYTNSDYSNGNLDPESNVGKAFKDQRVVAKVLKISINHDCNCSDNFGHQFDLYNEGRYNYINVKGSALFYSKTRSPRWVFSLIQEVTPDTYIMLGYDKDRKNILNVWVTHGVDDLVYDKRTETLLKAKSIPNTYKGLKKAEPWEVDVKPYNDALHSMSLDNCSVLRSD